MVIGSSSSGVKRSLARREKTPFTFPLVTPTSSNADGHGAAKGKSHAKGSMILKSGSYIGSIGRQAGVFLRGTGVGKVDLHQLLQGTAIFSTILLMSIKRKGN
jgi:hypothetical protein